MSRRQLGDVLHSSFLLKTVESEKTTRGRSFLFSFAGKGTPNDVLFNGDVTLHSENVRRRHSWFPCLCVFNLQDYRPRVVTVMPRLLKTPIEPDIFGKDWSAMLALPAALLLSSLNEA